MPEREWGLAGCDVSFPYYELLSLATTRCGRLLHECLPLVLGDESGLQKSRRYIFESVDVFAMIFPRTIARAKLVDAASVGIHNRAGRRVRAKIAIIGHAIVIAVNRENLSAQKRHRLLGWVQRGVARRWWERLVQWRHAKRFNVQEATE